MNHYEFKEQFSFFIGLRQGSNLQLRENIKTLNYATSKT